MADLLADHTLFQQYIMGPLLQVAMSGSGLGRAGVAIAGANSPVDPEEIAKFGTTATFDFFGPSRAWSSALCHPTRAVGHPLRRGHACYMPIADADCRV